jgi:hypothetical protein
MLDVHAIARDVNGDVAALMGHIGHRRQPIEKGPRLPGDRDEHSKRSRSVFLFKRLVVDCAQALSHRPDEIVARGRHFTKETSQRLRQGFK